MKPEPTTSFIVRADFNFAMVPQWVIMQGFSASAISVYTVLAMYRNSQTSDCYPSKATICERTGLTSNTVGKALKELESDGAIKVEKRFFGRSQTSNLYTLFMTGPYGIPQGFKPIEKGQGGSIDAPPPAMVGGEGIPTVGGVTKPNNQTKETRNNSPATFVADDGFDDFWSVYPRRIGKGKARVKWKQSLKKTDAATIIDGARKYAEQRAGEEPKYTAHPASWLNAERWLDEPDPEFRQRGNRRDEFDALFKQATQQVYGQKELGA